MSKSGLVEREILKRLEQERFEKRLRQARSKKHRNRVRSGPPGLSPAAVAKASYGKRREDEWLELPVPRALDLGVLRQQTCAFFKEVRSLIRGGRRVCLVFADTDSVSPEGLIYLLGQVQRLRLEYGPTRITGTYPESKRIERLLEESGFFGVLQVKRRGAAQRRSSATRYLKCKSDTKLASDEIPKLRDELLGTDLRMPIPIGKKVFRALTEAMTNVSHHAYYNKHLHRPRLRGRWWLAAQLSVKKNMFTLTFYDAGVGIPATLTRRYTWERIRGVLSLLPGIDPDDGAMIKAAVELGRSGTDLQNRGKGLLDLLKLIDQVSGGALEIFSRRGYYQYAHGREKYKTDVGYVEGTLIKWELPLNMVLTMLPEIPDDDPEA